jgi:hypothetical protein
MENKKRTEPDSYLSIQALRLSRIQTARQNETTEMIMHMTIGIRSQGKISFEVIVPRLAIMQKMLKQKSPITDSRTTSVLETDIVVNCIKGYPRSLELEFVRNFNTLLSSTGQFRLAFFRAKTIDMRGIGNPYHVQFVHVLFANRTWNMDGFSR